MTDITEVPTHEGKLYVCVVINLYSKLVLGWSMYHRQDRHTVIRAVEMAVWARQDCGDVILHSDRGCQFTHNMLVCSMSAVGHCGDNAACEGFKRERIRHGNLSDLRGRQSRRI